MHDDTSGYIVIHVNTWWFVKIDSDTCDTWRYMLVHEDPFDVYTKRVLHMAIRGSNTWLHMPIRGDKW